MLIFFKKEMQFTREVYNGGPHWKVARKAAQLFRFCLSLEIPSCNSVEFTVETRESKFQVVYKYNGTQVW